MDLRVLMDPKSSQLKNQSRSEIFNVPGNAQEIVNGTTINAFDVRLVVQFRVRLIIHLALHLKVHFKIYIKCTKGAKKVQKKLKKSALDKSCCCSCNCQITRVYNMIP